MMPIFENRLALPEAEVYYTPSLLSNSEAELVLERLITETPWRSETITLWGKTYTQPRWIAWYGDAGSRYTYSNKTWEPLPWTPLLLSLKDRVASACSATFNSVLLNYYRSEQDSMGFHSDDEPELGPNPVIGSVSLGAERALIFQHKTRKDQPLVRVPLGSGSLLLMQGETQRCWKHGIRKQTRACGPRVNLTFRTIFP